MTVKVYTSDTCPRCKILKTKLQDVSIPYQEITEVDYNMLRSHGIMSLPVIELPNGDLLDFAKSILMINEYKKNPEYQIKEN